MPELPDVVVYVEAIGERIVGHTLTRATIRGPFLLRSVTPPVDALLGRRAIGVRRAGKRIAIEFEGDIWLAIHMMIAGRLHWNGKRQPLAAFEFDSGTLSLTEAGTQHRAQLHVLDRAPEAVGVEPLEASQAEFGETVRSANHTLKRALTDPRLFSGIGNAYSDEILHRAQLSPVTLTLRLSDDEITRRMTRRARRWWNGWSVCVRRRGVGFRRRSRHFARRWRCMASMGSRARGVGLRSNASDMHRTRLTIAPCARRAEGC
jgi:formamidopyrimidine-DNA glycosylase